MLVKIINSLNKNLARIKYNKNITNNVIPYIYSIPQDYSITKIGFSQPINFELSYYKFSYHAKRLLQYFLGAFNYWGVGTIYKSFKDLRLEARMSKYAINQAMKEIIPTGILSRKCHGYKNKSHWTISITKFWTLGLRTFSVKVNQLLEVIFLKNMVSANSYNRESLSLNKIIRYLEDNKLSRDFCSFFELKGTIQKLIPNKYRLFSANYLEKWREKMEDSYQKYVVTPIRSNFVSKFEKKLPQIEQISEFDRRERISDGIKRQEDANRAFLEDDVYGNIKQANKIEQDALNEGLTMYEKAMQNMRGIFKK